MKKELQLMGLTETEAVVYEALVELGPCKAGALIARLDLHRNIIYRCLDSLVVNGYSTKIVKNGVWWFQISDPESLLISAHRRETVFGELVKEINERQSRAASQIVVYEGAASYRNYWVESLDRLPDGTVDCVAGGDVSYWSDVMGKYKDVYMKKSLKKKMSWKSLYFQPLMGEELRLFNEVPVPRECRVWDPADPNFFGNFNVIADTVVFHTPADVPRVIEMRDKSLVRTFQGMFDLMWAVAKPLEVKKS